ncbi:MAG: class I SAM-dependent methyltransferase, partial [Anaerolinea sp.]|nr:class I SAM-dependent methyltransferase [Anaerolinea sp.]
RTESIVKAARLAPGARVLDVGTGVGVLIPHLRRAGAGHIVACDLSQQMLAHAQQRHGTAADFLHCDILDLPADLQPFDAVFFNAMFGNLYDPAAALCRARELLRPGGQIIISHPMGRAWHSHLRTQHADMVLHDLPDRDAAVALFEACGLRLQEFVDEDDLYIAIATSRESCQA